MKKAFHGNRGYVYDEDNNGVDYHDIDGNLSFK